MPNACCVPSCCSGYKGTTEKVSLFCLASDGEQRDNWKWAILRQETGGFSFNSKYVRVCKKHFDASEITRADEYVVKRDAVSLQRDKPILRPNAIPRKFDGLSAYLTKAKPRLGR